MNTGIIYMEAVLMTVSYTHLDVYKRQGLWSLIQDQILGMKWLKDAVGSGLTAMGTDISSRLGGSVHFFIYDIIKITILLCTLIFLISYIQSYFPPERSKRILGRFHGLGARIAAALLGTVTPFCSCSSIPLFMGFTGAGLPLGVTFSDVYKRQDYTMSSGHGTPPGELSAWLSAVNAETRCVMV